MDKYVIRRDGRLYDTGYNSLTIAKINARSWCEDIGGLWQVFKLVKVDLAQPSSRGEEEMYSVELKDK